MQLPLRMFSSRIELKDKADLTFRPLGSEELLYDYLP
jgi:hypothetical protein